MKGKYWFILLIVLIVLIVLAYLVGSVTGTPVSMAAPGPAQGAAPSETSESQTAAAIHAPADMATATPNLDGMKVNRWMSTSPDGQWIAEGVVAFHKTDICCPMYYTGLILRSADGKRQWTIVDRWEEVGLGWTYPQPVRWSKDGRSFYYTNRPVVEGCGTFVNGSDLHKVDLDSGMVSEVLPPSTFWIALSPDETTLAYIGGRSGLVLRDLASGQEREVSIDPGKEYSSGQIVAGQLIEEVYAAGQIVWSPDGKALALTLAFNACGMIEYAESTSILLVDAVSLAIQVVLLEDKRLLVTEEWVQTDQVVLSDPQGNRWIWDVESGAIDR